MTPLCCPIGHAAGTASVVVHDGWTLAPWSSSPPSELRVTRVFPCVARGLKARPSFMFAGCCWWRSLAVDSGSGTSRGHGSVMRRPGSRWDGGVERPSAFSGRTYHKLLRIVRVSCAVADHRCLPLVAAAAVAVAVNPPQAVRWQADLHLAGDGPRPVRAGSGLPLVF